jgi:hypothetical protein
MQIVFAHFSFDQNYQRYHFLMSMCFGMLGSGYESEDSSGNEVDEESPGIKINHVLCFFFSLFRTPFA